MTTALVVVAFLGVAFAGAVLFGKVARGPQRDDSL